MNVAEEMLAGLGDQPVGFSSSVDALTAFRAEPERYDIVLTDETMPDMTGTELAPISAACAPTSPSSS